MAREKVRLVIEVSEEKRRIIKAYAAREGLSITELMLRGFELFRGGADAFIELVKMQQKLDEKDLAWADKILQAIDLPESEL